MRRTTAEIIGLGFLLVVGLFLHLSPLLAQTTTGQQGRTSRAIPELSGVWESPNELNDQLNPNGQRFDICDEPSCRALLELPSAMQLITTVEEPRMLPWAEELYRASREDGAQNPNVPGREEADPWFSACLSTNPAALMLSPFVAVEVRQFQDVVLLLYSDDHVVRRVYVDGRGHPSDLTPTWTGHSIGRYDSDTLIVDTIGIKGQRWLDPQAHPHSDVLHLVERVRRVDESSLEFEVTIDDPKAYKNAWVKKTVRKLAAPGPRIWDGSNCEELLQMGTHYGVQ